MWWFVFFFVIHSYWPYSVNLVYKRRQVHTRSFNYKGCTWIVPQLYLLKNGSICSYAMIYFCCISSVEKLFKHLISKCLSHPCAILHIQQISLQIFGLLLPFIEKLRYSLSLSINYLILIIDFSWYMWYSRWKRSLWNAYYYWGQFSDSRSSWFELLLQ